MGIYCTNNIYFYKGWIIEFHHYCGPWPLKKDFQPKKYAGRKFWQVWKEFDSLTKEEKDTYLEHKGGCHKF